MKTPHAAIFIAGPVKRAFTAMKQKFIVMNRQFTAMKRPFVAINPAADRGDASGWRSAGDRLRPPPALRAAAGRAAQVVPAADAPALADQPPAGGAAVEN